MFIGAGSDTLTSCRVSSPTAAASTTGTAVSDAARIALTASITLAPLATANTASLTAPSSRTVRDSTPRSSAPCALRNLTTSIWVTIR